MTVSKQAQLLLDISGNQAERLFNAHPLGEKIITQRIAAKVLRLLATDGIVRWERFQ